MFSASRTTSLIAAYTSGGPDAIRRAISQARSVQLVSWYNLIDKTPAVALPRVEPAPGQQHFHRDVIGNSFGQLDGRCVGDRARTNFRQSKSGVLCSNYDVGAQGNLEPAAATNAIDRADHRLVEIIEFLNAAESADPIVAVNFLTASGRFQVPAGGKKLFTAAGNDRDPEIRVIAKIGKNLANANAGGAIDGIGFGSVDVTSRMPPSMRTFTSFSCHDVYPCYFSSGRSSSRLMMWR